MIGEDSLALPLSIPWENNDLDLFSHCLWEPALETEV